MSAEVITIEEIERQERQEEDDIFDLSDVDDVDDGDDNLERIKISDNKEILIPKKEIKYIDGVYKNVPINYNKTVSMTIRDSFFIEAQIKDKDGTITLIKFRENSNEIANILVTKGNKVKENYSITDDVVIKLPIKKI